MHTTIKFVCIKHVDNSSSKCEWKKSTSFFDTRRDHSLHLTIYSYIGMKKNVIRVVWYCEKNRRKKGLKSKKEARKGDHLYFRTWNIRHKNCCRMDSQKQNFSCHSFASFESRTHWFNAKKYTDCAIWVMIINEHVKATETCICLRLLYMCQ